MTAAAPAGAAGYLLVRAGHRRVGLPIGYVVAVIDPGPVYAVPAVGAAVRGVARVRGRILPVVHLGAMLDGGHSPETRGDTGVIVAAGSEGGGQICFEVEAAELVLRDSGLPVPPGAAMPWAVAVTRYDGELVPLLDLHALAGALTEMPEAAAAPASASDARVSEARPG